MFSAEKHRAPRRHPAVWWSRMKLRWPFLIWILAIVAALWLYTRSGRVSLLRGVVETVHETVALQEIGRLEHIYVHVGQTVTSGMLLASCNTELIEAEMAVTRMRLLQQFDRAIARAQEEKRTLRRQHAENSAELQALRNEISRMSSLVSQRLMDAQDMTRYTTRAQSLAETVETFPAYIEEIESLLSSLYAQRDAMEKGLIGTHISHTILYEDEEADAALHDLYGWLTLRKKAFHLRAHNDGVVALIHAHPGDTLQAGTPIISLLTEQPGRVIGFLPEWLHQTLHIGMHMHIVPASGGPASEGVVTRIFPDVGPPPVEMDLFPVRNPRGRSFFVDITQNNGVIPGEAVHLVPERTWFSLAWFRERLGL